MIFLFFFFFCCWAFSDKDLLGLFSVGKDFLRLFCYSSKNRMNQILTQMGPGYGPAVKSNLGSFSTVHTLIKVLFYFLVFFEELKKPPTLIPLFSLIKFVNEFNDFNHQKHVQDRCCQPLFTI